MLIIETILVITAVLIAGVYPTLGSRSFERVECLLTRVARRKRLTVALAGLCAIGARLLLIPVLPVPTPGLPDEFGYLLSGDTFAHFRLRNPTHPMWEHFENLAAIQQPSYASKYFPGQGIVLALGQVFFGHPFWGVCLSMSLMCAAITWMLQGWLPGTWALVGGLLAIVRIGMFSYWSNSYWGGAVAAVGGALLLGSLPRMKKNQRVLDAVVMGIGLAVLGSSRPYEGLCLALPVLLSFLFWIATLHSADKLKVVRRLLLPLSACILFTGILAGYYCWRVTGEAWRTPYGVAQDTYYPTPLFVFQPLRPTPTIHHAVFRTDFERWELPVYRDARHHPFLTSAIKLTHFWLFFFGPVLSLPFAAMLFILPYGYAWRDFSLDTRFLLGLVLISLLAMLLPLFFNPGYAAPLTAVLYAVILKAFRRLRKWTSSGKPTGIALCRATVLICFALIAVRLAASKLHIPLSGARTWCSQDFQLTDRAYLQHRLTKAGGRHLILVKYPEPDPGPITYWVSNDADIDGSPIVWAFDMGQENRELIHYFKDRRVWLLQAGTLAPKLSPVFAESNSELQGAEAH